MSLLVQRFAVGGYDANLSYVIADDATRQAILVDPAGEVEQPLRFIAEQGLTLDGVFITHSHHDHWDALARVDEVKLVPVYAHADTLEAAGRSGELAVAVTAENTLGLGECALVLLETPGHSPDSLCMLILPEHTVDGLPHLVSGDTLFIDGCGRTTPEAAPILYDSLQQLKTLPLDTVIHPCHDYGPAPDAPLGAQLETNRFLRAPDYETFVAERFPNSAPQSPSDV